MITKWLTRLHKTLHDNQNTTGMKVLILFYLF